MIDPADPVAAAVRRLIRERAPALPEPIPDDAPLTADGLGLDSLAVVEILLELETELSIPFRADLLAGTPITVGKLTAHARSHGR